MSSKLVDKIIKSTAGAILFTYQDRSSEETIKINNRLSITTGNWLAVKDQFIEERYSRRKHPAWSRAEWAQQEQKILEKIDFSNSQDRQVLKERYLRELSKIINGRIKSIEQPLSFKWTGENCQLKKLFDELNGKYINATWSKFKQLFGEKDIKSLEPVQWKQANWELFFLIEELSNHFELIEHKEINVKILNCFIDKNGNPFKIESIKQQKSEAKRSMAGSAIKQDYLKRILYAVNEAQE
jgi:hypothetical protein